MKFLHSVCHAALKRTVCVFGAAVLALSCCAGTAAAGNLPGQEDRMEYYDENAVAAEADAMAVPAKSALLMDAVSGRVLFEMNADEPLPPASITKIMTLLLTFEALENGMLTLDQIVTVSEHAASMGGTQIWLEPGEEMCVEDLIRAAAVNSANDAAAALAEAVSGSEENFAVMMNEKAEELHMTGTHFVNATGLDAEGHISTARDVARMSRALMQYPEAMSYTSVWMDSLRDGKTALVNTNKLVRFYKGCIGIKTGTTDGAGSCLSAAASRGDLSLIAVSMGSKTSAERFESCRTLLDYGFSSFERFTPELPEDALRPVPVLHGTAPFLEPAAEEPPVLPVPKGRSGDIQLSFTLPDQVDAPVQKGQIIGSIVCSLDGEKLCEILLRAPEDVPLLDFQTAFKFLWEKLFQLKNYSF